MTANKEIKKIIGNSLLVIDESAMKAAKNIDKQAEEYLRNFNATALVVR